MSIINSQKTIRFAAQDEIIDFSKYAFIPYGKDNLAPEKILNLLANNKFFAATVNVMSGMIAGEGLDIESESEYEKQIAEQLLEKLCIDNNFLERTAMDLAVFNTLACQVIRDANTILPAKVVHTRVSQVRAGMPDMMDNIEYYYLARDWSVIDNKLKVRNIYNKAKLLYEPIKIPKWMPGTIEERTLIYKPKYSPVMHYYALPLAESALLDLEQTVLISEYQNSILKNTISGSMIITVYRTPKDNIEEELAEQQKISENIRESLAGTMNAGKATIIFSSIDGKPSEIRPAVTDDNDKRYLEISELNKFNVFTALGVVAPELFGVPTAAGFSSEAEKLIMANELMHINVIAPLQKLLTDTIELILSAFDLNVKVFVKKRKFIGRMLPESLQNSGIFTKNEIREMYGFNKIEETI